MEKMDKVMEGVLEYLKHKGKLTELEKDILLAVQICQSSPFDSVAAKKKIMEFNINIWKYAVRFLQLRESNQNHCRR